MVLGKEMDVPFPCVLRQSYGKRKLENNGKNKGDQMLLLPAKNRRPPGFFLWPLTTSHLSPPLTSHLSPPLTLSPPMISGFIGVMGSWVVMMVLGKRIGTNEKLYLKYKKVFNFMFEYWFNFVEIIKNEKLTWLLSKKYCFCYKPWNA